VGYKVRPLGISNSPDHFSPLFALAQVEKVRKSGEKCIKVPKWVSPEDRYLRGCAQLLSSSQAPNTLPDSLRPSNKSKGKVNETTEEDEYNGESLVPDFADAPKINFEVAVAVAECAALKGSALVDWFGDTSTKDMQDPSDDMKLKVKEMTQEKVWVPVYPEYEYDAEGMTEV
jgi:hypothetical protein